MAEPETLRVPMDVGAEASGEAPRREANFELRKGRLFSGKSLDLSPPSMVDRKAGGERAALAGRCHGCPDCIPFVLEDAQ